MTPTNDLHLLRLDPSSNRMTLELGQDGRRPPGRFPLELPASPLSPLRSPLSRVESTRCEKYSLYFKLKLGLIIDNFAKIRSRGSGKGKESEYENGESDCPDEEEVSFHMLSWGPASQQESSLSEHTTYKDQVDGQYHSAQIGIKRGLLNISRDSEQRETDEFEEAERRMLAEEAKVGLDSMFLLLVSLCVFICVQNSLLDSHIKQHTLLHNINKW